MAEELPKERAIPKPQPVVPFPGLPATDCMGDCCDQHYTLQMATQLVKAGRRLEQQALKLALTKMKAIAEKDGRAETATAVTGMLEKLATGELTGLKA